MIQQDTNNSYVSASTLSTEYLEISSTPIDRDLAYSLLKTQIEKEVEAKCDLCAEIKKLRAQVALLTSHNQTLQNCWQSAIVNHTEADAQTRAWISRAALKNAEIYELRGQVLELKQHLNPKEEAEA